MTHFFKSLLSDNLNQDGYNILNRNSLQIAYDRTKENTVIHVSEDLKVEYVNEYEPSSYRVWVNQVLDKKLEPRSTKVQSEGSRFQTTRISPLDKKIIINKNGQIINQETIVLNGYMGWERVAELLPFDYTIEKK